MSNVFDKAAQIAQDRQAWEAKVNPNGDAWALRKFSEKEMAESQKQIDAFQDALVKAAKAGKFKAPEQVKAALDALDYDKQFMPLRSFAENCMPVQADTMLVAGVLAPARVATIGRVKDGSFGVYVSEPASDGVVVHKAAAKVDSPNSVRGSMAREQVEAKQAEQGKAFKELSGAIGVAMKGAKPGKTLEQAHKELSRLSGLKVVEGERASIGATNKAGQIGLFGEDLAPTPPKAKDAKPAAKALAPKARKAGK